MEIAVLVRNDRDLLDRDEDELQNKVYTYVSLLYGKAGIPIHQTLGQPEDRDPLNLSLNKNESEDESEGQANTYVLLLYG